METFRHPLHNIYTYTLYDYIAEYKFSLRK